MGLTFVKEPNAHGFGFQPKGSWMVIALVTVQYLRCSQERAAHSGSRTCPSGTHTCTLCPTEPLWRCWDMEHTCRRQTHPGTAAAPSAGGAAW